MTAINDIAGIHRQIEEKFKRHHPGYAMGWTAHICTELEIDQKHLWTEPVKKAVLKILRPLITDKNLLNADQIFPLVLRELKVLEISEGTGLISDLASIVFDYWS